MENLNPEQANNQGKTRKIGPIVKKKSSDSYSCIDVFQAFK